MAFVYNPISNTFDIVGTGGSGPGPSFPANYKDPVITAASLPVGTDGDVRVVLDEATVYVYSATESAWVPQRAPKDIQTTTQAILNNQSTPVEITSFKLNNQVFSFESSIEVTLTTTSPSIERGVIHMYASYDGVDWQVSTTKVGADPLSIGLTVQYDIGGNPTVFYTTANRVDFGNAQIKFRANSL